MSTSVNTRFIGVASSLSVVSDSLIWVTIINSSINIFMFFKFELGYSNDCFCEILYIYAVMGLRPKGHNIRRILSFSCFFSQLIPLISRINKYKKKIK